jgi:hypothetical protein
MAAFSNQLPEGQLSRAVIESLLKLQHPLSDHMVQATLVALVEKACMRAAEQSAAGNVIYRQSSSRKRVRVRWVRRSSHQPERS